jgi:hypothetical protein
MMSPYACDDDVARVGKGFLDRTLPRAEWTHAAHFAAALWLMRHRPEIELSRDMPGLIRAFNEAKGRVNDDTTGYHETITQASLRAARPFLDANPDVPLFQVVAALLRTELGNPNWLLQYWSRERLMSVDARRTWLEPDRKPLPF